MLDELPLATPQEFVDLIATIPEDSGFTLVTQHGDPEGMLRVRRVMPDTIERWNNDPTLFHIVVLASRSIAMEFCRHIEHKYFVPGTSRNDLYRVTYYRWKRVTWMIFTVPIVEFITCVHGAKEIQMGFVPCSPTYIDWGHRAAVVSARTIPARVGGFDTASATKTRFPLAGLNTMTLEPDYKGTRGEGRIVGISAQQQPHPEYKHSNTVIDDILAKFRDKQRPKS